MFDGSDILDFALKRLASMADSAEGLYMYHAKAHRQTNSENCLHRSYISFKMNSFMHDYFLLVWRSGSK